MPARYQDAWIRAQFAPDKDRFTVETPPDPGHGDRSDATSPTVMMDAPVMPGGGEVITDALFETYVAIPIAQKIDKTPIEGHGTGSARGRGYGDDTRPYSQNEQYGRRQMGRVRGRDDGAPEDITTQVGPYKFHDEQWFGITTDGLEPPPITQGPGDIILRRGLNAYPENDGDSGRPRAWTVNMPSWKRGVYYNSNVNRDFTPPHRTHGEVKMVRPDIVTIVGDAPPPDRPDKYASPFSSLQKFMPKGRRIRGLRRIPGPWDQGVVASAQELPTPMNYDGMVVP